MLDPWYLKCWLKTWTSLEAKSENFGKLLKVNQEIRQKIF